MTDLRINESRAPIEKALKLQPFMEFLDLIIDDLDHGKVHLSIPYGRKILGSGKTYRYGNGRPDACRI